MPLKRFKDVRKSDRFTDREGHLWFVNKIHRKTKEVTAWRHTTFHEHLHFAGRLLHPLEIRFRISEINHFKWERPA